MKIRLDQLLVQKGLTDSRSKARALILAGKVYSPKRRFEKAGELVDPTEILEVREALPFVSRGGIKLAHALEAFSIHVDGQVALDVGASTGGFTDCLLQKGARKVYAVDVGYGQLDWSLRENPDVVVIERTNVRHWKGEELIDLIDLVTLDVSFISVTKVLPVIEELLKVHGSKKVTGIILIKPQFEAGRSEVGSGGVVRDITIQERVVQEIEQFIVERGWHVLGITPSPIKGPKGNQEYFIVTKKAFFNSKE